MPDVFISYNREDRETAKLVASGLEAEGFSVWWDAALRAGETYDEVTEQNLRTAGAVVVLWSKRSAQSKWVRAEATVGERASTLVPALIEDCDRPIRFELVQTADLRHWRGDRNDPHWRGFMQDVRMAIAKRGGRGQASAAASAPGVDSSVETAFWNSIKDGTDRADFEAYLKRYPNGHFAQLAQNRLAALARGAAPGPRPAPGARPAPAAPRQVAPAARPAAAKPAPPPARPKKSGAGVIIGVIALLLAGIGVAAFMTAKGGKGGPAAAAQTAATAATETAPIEPDAPVAEEAAVASDDLLTDELAAADDATAVDAAVETPLAEEAPVETAEAEIEAAPTEFRDCDSCPLMKMIPAGTFLMGSPADEAGRNAYEGPQREVTIKAFAIGAYEVTNEEWAACVADGACARKGGDGPRLPALGVSWDEATAYVNWLTRKSGRKYRLPSEAEWEYAARGGSAGAYWWGEKFDRARVATNAPSAVGSYAANAFGLYDVLGNAREWVADCYVNNYVNAPTDGAPVRDGDCGKRVIRGGAWSSAPADMRVANRSRIDTGVSARYMGFRTAAEIE